LVGARLARFVRLCDGLYDGPGVSAIRIRAKGRAKMDINPGYAVAAVVSLLALGIHVFIGGKLMVRPLLACDLPRQTKWLLYLCFHLASLMVLTMTLVFGWAALSFLGRPAAMVLTGVALGAMLLSLFVSLRGRLALQLNPPVFLYAMIFAGAFWGSFGSLWDVVFH
jgi:hypothetical protein